MDMDWEAFKKETEDVKQMMLFSRATADAAEKADKQNKRLWVAVYSLIGTVAMIVALAIGSFLYMQNHMQGMMNRAVENALRTVAEFQIEGTTTTETTQTVEGDSAQINNVEGNQYKDNATHNEGVTE